MEIDDGIQDQQALREEIRLEEEKEKAALEKIARDNYAKKIGNKGFHESLLLELQREQKRQTQEGIRQVNEYNKNLEKASHQNIEDYNNIKKTYGSIWQK